VGSAKIVLCNNDFTFTVFRVVLVIKLIFLRYSDSSGAALVRLKTKLHAGLREIAGTSEVDLELEGEKTVLLSVLRELCQMFGPVFSNNFFDEKGEYKGFCIITLNGTDMRRLSGLETEVSSGDLIDIIPPASGG
jgi:MoaD family protein